MKNSITAIAAFAATALASAVTYTACEGNCGSVEIVSHCDEDIYFSNVPSQGDAIGTTCLKAGDTYSQVFTAMPNLSGWSMKLSPDESFPGDNTQQYEYTWQGGEEPVWYDMSYVNGQPYAGKWNFTSSDNSICNPTDSAYRYSTDDAYGMQTSCPSSVTLTLHLCPNDAGSSSSGSSSSSSSEAAPASTSTESPSSTSSYVAPSTSSYVAPSSSSTTQAYTAPSSSLTTSQTTLATSTSSRRAHYTGYGNKAQVDSDGDVQVAAESTTSVPVTTSVAGGPIVTETQVDVVTQVQTMVVTARDAAPSAHAHKLRHEHRHPHGGRA